MPTVKWADRPRVESDPIRLSSGMYVSEVASQSQSLPWGHLPWERTYGRWREALRQHIPRA